MDQWLVILDALVEDPDLVLRKHHIWWVTTAHEL